MTDQLEQLIDAMYLDRVPAQWSKLAYPSTRGLSSWMNNLRRRLDQINIWKDDPLEIPKVVFLNRLFNPQSFLTAIKQVASREFGFELNKLFIKTEIQKKFYEEADQLPALKEGAYTFGFHVDGARWDPTVGSLEESFPKRPYSVVPVVTCKALLIPDG